MILKTALVLGGFLLVQSENLTMRVSPHVGIAPQDVLVELHVPSNPQNVSIVLEVDGDGYYSQSKFDLDADTPPTLNLLRRNIPAGRFEVKATLNRERKEGDEYVAAYVTTTIEVQDGTP